MAKEYLDSKATGTLADFERCPDNMSHDWVYRGRNPGNPQGGEYRCKRCGVYVTKTALKEATDD